MNETNFDKKIVTEETLVGATSQVAPYQNSAEGATLRDGEAVAPAPVVLPKPSLPFRAVKRTFDAVAATCGLVILSPVLLCVAVAVKATSPGPAIFKQQRYGRDKKPFTCYKFRSMTVDTPSDVPTRVMNENKAVMTPIGATLRKTSLDELPQMLNIVKGDMSVIGPRPMILAEYDQIAERDLYGANDIRPGLTGWAQINGRDAVTLEQKAILDGEYRRKMGFAMDTRVFWRSIIVVLGRIGYADGKKEPAAEQNKDAEQVEAQAAPASDAPENEAA